MGVQIKNKNKHQKRGGGWSHGTSVKAHPNPGHTVI